MASVVEMACPQETVQYYIFLNKNKLGNANDDLAEKYISFLSRNLVEYIWHNEPFYLKESQACENLPPHLKGQVNYGDNVEDEWFVVYLLFELTKAFPDLIVSVKDSDGEILLIEAAEVLPKWIDPETSENRVYIHRGNVHIIPLSETEKQDKHRITVPSIETAIETIRKNPLMTKARDSIQTVVKKKISRYPQAIKANQHQTQCKVPAAIAVLLKEQPSLLSAAVHTFYYRDPVDLKACRAMKFFPPETCVLTNVTFSRCQYAQLMQQQFRPDRRTGWEMPPVNHPSFKSHDLGVKIACGFEILANNAAPSTEDSLPSFHDLNADVRWNAYVRNLKEKNYFQDEMEGSKLHNSLMSQARDFYCSTLNRNSDKYDQNVNIGSRIRKMLENIEIDMEKLKNEEKYLEKPQDDDWLEISPEQLDSMLAEKSTSLPTDVASEIPEKLSQFVNHVSSYEGAEFPKKGKTGRGIKFDAEHFTDACKNILDLNVPEWKDGSGSSSGMSDYEDEELDSDDDETPVDLKTKRSIPKRKIPKGMATNQEMEDYFKQMEQELASTTMINSFEKVPCEKAADESSEPEDIQAVNVDLTALKNILESYSCQEGLPGPASTLLGRMGIEIPENSDEI